jgi:hypothetical protein
MRALGAIYHGGGNSQERLVKALDALFYQYWVKQVPTHQPETLKSSLSEIFGTQEAERSTSADREESASYV